MLTTTGIELYLKFFRLPLISLIVRLLKSLKHKKYVKVKELSLKVFQTRSQQSQRIFQNNQNLSVTLKMRMMLIQMLKRRFLMLIEKNLFKSENNSLQSLTLSMVMDFGQDSYFSSLLDFQMERTNPGTLLQD